MVDEKEQELKVLERALQNQDGARQTFFRDLKFATVLLLAFQFLIFFRFVDLKGRASRLEQQITPLRTEHAGLQEVEENLESVKGALQQGQQQLATWLRGAPSNMRAQLQQLGQDIAVIRSVPEVSLATEPTRDWPVPVSNSANQLPPNIASPGAGAEFPRLPSATDVSLQGITPPSPGLPILGQFPPNMPRLPTEMAFPNSPAIAYPGPEFLLGLSNSDQQILKSTEVEDPAFRKLLYRLVENRIVKPTFDSLNNQLTELLVRPLKERQRLLLLTLDKRGELLTKYGLETAVMREKVEAMESLISSLRIHPPASPSGSASDQPTLEPWWTTFRGKTGEFETREAETDHVVKQAFSELEQPEKQLAVVDQALGSLLEVTEAKQAETTHRLKQLEKQSEHIQSLLIKFAAPLPVISLGLEDAVVYYPVVLAIAFCYFVWGNLRLRQRARSLAATCRDFGLSDRVVRTYFTELPAVGKLAIPRPMFAYDAVALLWGLPGVLAALSIFRILTSSDLSGSAPQMMYVLAGGAMLVAYVALALDRSRQAIPL